MQVGAHILFQYSYYRIPITHIEERRHVLEAFRGHVYIHQYYPDNMPELLQQGECTYIEVWYPK